jgi:putative DNA primase/helicase
VPTIPPARRRDDADDDASRNRALAASIWRSARPIKGTLAEHYLAHIRGIDIEQIPNIDDCLRFTAGCPFDGGNLPCLIALARDVATDEPKAITRTALDGEAKKIERRALGPKRRCAVKLWPDADVATGLVVGEGLETVAAAATRIEHNGTCLQPAWALIDCINLRDLQVLSGIEALTILVDHDQAGQSAADICTRRWLAAGHCVEQLIPRTTDTDFNDIAMGGGE